MMIDQTAGLNSTTQSERIYRENSTGQTGQRRSSREQDPDQQPSPGTDTVSLSAEAIARLRAVPPAGAANEAQESTASETRDEDAQEQQQRRYESIDIRV
jgi:hypothetical protein